MRNFVSNFANRYRLQQTINTMRHIIEVQLEVERNSPISFNFRPWNLTYYSAYKNLSDDELKKVKSICFERSDFGCEVEGCPYRAERDQLGSLRVDEIVRNDFLRRVRRIIDIRTICRDCYDTIHLNQTDEDRREEMQGRLRHLFNWTQNQIEEKFRKQDEYKKNIERDRVNWKANSDILNRYLESRVPEESILFKVPKRKKKTLTKEYLRSVRRTHRKLQTFRERQ